MPLSIKQISRQVATPSPTQTGDVLNKLLATKDIINRTLLSQHKRASYLANVLIEVEENIRETTEIAVKNIKNDIEKSKRKITPGIKRLQDSLKGLSKSETFIKHDDKGGKNADTKKAKRRIKEAQKLMQDFPSGNVEYSVSTCLADHITQLCNRLMQLSIKITSSKFDYNETPRNYQSDSDSDERTQRMNERSNSANNIYDEIGHYLEDDPYLRPTRKTEIKDQERRPEVPPLLLSHLEPSELSKLNSVHLFSSDSDSDDDFDTGKFMPFNLQPRNRSPLVRQPRIGEIKQHKETRYVREGVRRSRSPKSPKPDNGVREHNSPKQDKPVDNIHGTKFTSKVNRMSGGNHGSLQKPIDNYVETMSSTLDRTKSETRALTFESYSKPTPKRLLPAIPKPADDVTDGVTILPRVICTNTNQDAVVSEEQSNMKTEQHIPVNTNIMPYVDIEEIEFRKTIRTARKEILDKLKRKNRGTPVNETSVSEELKMSDLVSNHSTQNTSQISNFALTLPYSKPTQVTGVPIMSRTISSVSRMNDNGIFKSKLVQVGSSVNNPNDSIVSSNIKKFEATIWNNELVELNNSKLKHSTPPRKNGPHLRSSSEPRSTLSVIKSSAKFLRRPSPLKNNALRPRHDSSGSSTFNDSEKDKTEDSAIGSSSNGSSFLLKSCTENDLNDLVRNESPNSIRKQWSMRRSSSLNTRAQPTPNKTVVSAPQKQGPIYVKCSSFSIPEHESRCHAAAIVILDSGRIVVLDERHFYIHLFDKTFQHVFELKLYDIPRNCQKIDGTRFAVAIPYKRKVSYYSENNASIIFLKDISILCTEWILDISSSLSQMYVLCKKGHVHVISNDGKESSSLNIGISGRLAVDPTGKRIYVIGGRKITRYDMQGQLLSTITDVDTHSLLFMNSRVYVADRNKQKIRPLTDGVDMHDLTEEKIDFPSAMCLSPSGSILLVSYYEESLDSVSTRTITVHKLKQKVTNV